MTPERWQLVRGILQSAMELHPEERDAFLDRECAADPSLRKDVDEYLSVEGKLDPEFLESPAVNQVPPSTTADGNTLLAPGTRVGSYEVQALLGAGGMGEVYRARDTRLNRIVAIKVIPRSLSTDPARLQRFEREARAIAALQHPNICTLHDIGHQDGMPYLVLEHLDGETLAKRLQKGRLPFEHAVRYVSEVADALDAAHTKGVVHRDLKPANIFLTIHGEAKVLDFGIAKLDEPEPELDVSAETATKEKLLTTPGVAMGTAPYMSPEQVRGADLDARTDIFSLGAVLYEMATGKMAFAGKTTAVVHKAILDETPPPPSEVIPALPDRFDDIIGKALEKDRELRYQSAGDMRADLTRMRRGWESDKTGSAALSRRSAGKARRTWVWLTGAAVMLLLAGGYWYLSRPLPPPRITAYTQITHDGRYKILGGTDGSRLYFTQMSPNSFAQVGINGGEIAQLQIGLPPGNSGKLLLDVSADGSNALIRSLEEGHTIPAQWVAPFLGGAPKRLEEGDGGSFSPDGGSVIYFTLNGDIFMVRIDGSEKHRLAIVGSIASQFRWSPDGRVIRFSKEDGLWEMSSDGTGIHRLLPGWKEGVPCCGRWTQDGSLFVFWAGGQIWAIDERRSMFRRLPSAPIQLTSGPIRWDPPIPGKDGKKIFVGGSTPRGELTRIDPKTGAPQTFLDGISAEFVSFSPDGKFVAYVAFPEGTLWKANRDGSNRMRLTQQPDLAVNPRWSPDSQEIVYTLTRDGRSTIRRISALDGAPLWLMAEEPGEMHDSNWSPDGKKVLFGMGPSGWLGEAKRDLRIANLETRHVTILPGSDGFWSPRWSPDGRYMTALPRAQGNGLPVYDFTTRHWHVVPISGKTDFPTFSRDSRFIYFLRYGPDMGMFRVPVAGGKVERVVDLTNWHFTGVFEYSASLDPTDAPLVLRDTGSDDLYALTLEQK